jgi:diguanylate cyclase (GGDEF)-like protein
MSERRPRSFFGDETDATPIEYLATHEAVGPKRPCLLVIAGPRLGEIFPVEEELIIGRDHDAQVQLEDDEGVSRRHARVCPSGDGAMIADLGSANGVWVDGAKVSEIVLRDGAKIRIGQTTVLKYTRYDRMEEAAQRQLLESALRDGLTRAFNRRYFLSRLGGELHFADRHKQSLALLFIDLDHFKELNEKRGHHAGDEVLRRIVDLLVVTLRAEDVLARYGGEEFAVLARGIAEPNAMQLAERLRRVIASAEFGPPSTPFACTVSIGVATYPFDGADAETATDKLIARAGAALERAKQSGRNKISG